MATKSEAKKDTNAETKATNLTKEDREFLAKHGDQLSDSTRRAKWIHALDEHADRDGQTLATRSPEVIRAWAEERGGRPATVPGTEHDGRPGVLRFDFGGGDNDRLQEISWDDWFRTFQERNLVFLFQEKKADGSQSNFFRLDNPEREDA
jgi:hypothetical protein